MDAETVGFWPTERTVMLPYDAYLDESIPDHVLQLLADLVDPDDCWFDHHGGCQAHGYLGLEPGMLCPHHEAKQLLGSHGIAF